MAGVAHQVYAGMGLGKVRLRVIVAAGAVHAQLRDLYLRVAEDVDLRAQFVHDGQRSVANAHRAAVGLPGGGDRPGLCGVGHGRGVDAALLQVVEHISLGIHGKGAGTGTCPVGKLCDSRQASVRLNAQDAAGFRFILGECEVGPAVPAGEGGQIALPAEVLSLRELEGIQRTGCGIQPQQAAVDLAAPVLGGIGPFGEQVDEVAVRAEAPHGRAGGLARIVAEQGAALDRPRILNGIASLGKAQPSHAVGGACVRFFVKPIVLHVLGAEGVEPVPERGQVHQLALIVRIPLVDGVRFVAGGLHVDVVVRIDASGEVKRVPQRSAAPEAGERLVAEVLGRHAARVGEEVRLLVDFRVQHPCRPAPGGG